jgi:polygalacturonase
MMTAEARHAGATRRGVLKSMLGIGVSAAAAQKLAPGFADPQQGTSAGAAGTNPQQVSNSLYNVRLFGASGDGKTLDTPAINKAIEAARNAGGGTVRFPAGTYLCYSIHLQSNVALYLDHGSTILAADTTESGSGYDPPEPNPWDMYQDFGHSHWHNALIWGEALENVSILGPGLIWGKGLTRGLNERGPGVGDKAISLKNCHNVTLRDVSLLHGGHFGILATGVDNLTIDNLRIDTDRDGIDIDCCQNVRVSNCTVNSPWDDAICPKSSYALGYPRPTKNLTITNCYVTGGYQLGTLLDGTFKPFPAGDRAPHTGRIKCGTESNGGFQNVTISNCVFEECGGLALETVDGGLLEDVTISNITMRGVANLPIFLRLGRRLRGPAGTPVGKLRRVSISNVVASNTAGRYASIISGIPGNEIEDVKLSNIYVLTQGGRTRQDAALEPPEDERGYPEPTEFGPMPAYGFFLRHIKGIELSNIEVAVEKEDLRPAFVFSDVKGADVVHARAARASGAALFALKNVESFNIYLSRPVPDTHIESVGQTEL